MFLDGKNRAKIGKISRACKSDSVFEDNEK